MKRRRGQQQPWTALRVAPSLACPTCQRPVEECFCDQVGPLPVRTEVVILQHPREQFKLSASARLTQASLERSQLRVGLSWPNLAAALGRPAQPGDWAVLSLRGGKPRGDRPFQLFDRKDRPLEAADAPKGLIVLDGSWQQAKTLWWRNPWLLKLSRALLNPDHPSLRPQVRAAGLSTIEAVACALASLGEPEETISTLKRRYLELVIKPCQRHLAAQAEGPAAPADSEGSEP